MAVIQNIITALWQHDFAALADPHVVGIVYFVMFATLFLENGLLPASFLPGDSLLLLAGALIGKGVMDFAPTMVILTSAASLGCWLSYLQGRWLGNTRVVKAGWRSCRINIISARPACLTVTACWRCLPGVFWRSFAPCCLPWRVFQASLTAASSSSTG